MVYPAVVAFVVLAIAIFVGWRRRQLNPLDLDLRNIGAKLTVTRLDGSKISFTLMSLVPVITGDKSIEHMAEEFTKVLALEEPLTPVEFDMMVRVLSPRLAKFFAEVKKG